jgi:hypothetical protein
MTDHTPPQWADVWLRSLLPARDRDTVSGDLIEQYRDTIRPRRSQFAADVWYLGQVSRFAWRVYAWADVLAAIIVTRNAYDWFVPAADFARRAEMTTLLVFATLLVIGASSALRTQSVVAGTAATASALTLSAVFCTIAHGLLYLLWGNAATIAATGGSGGLAEVFTLPFTMIFPGTLIGWIGAALALARSSLREYLAAD